MNRDIIIVNDGEYRWGANTTDLMVALVVLGWRQDDAGVWYEPNRGKTRCFGQSVAYSELCARVRPIDGLGPDQTPDRDLTEFLTLTHRPDLGAGVWA